MNRIELAAMPLNTDEDVMYFKQKALEYIDNQEILLAAQFPVEYDHVLSTSEIWGVRQQVPRIVLSFPIGPDTSELWKKRDRMAAFLQRALEHKIHAKVEAEIKGDDDDGSE